RPRRDQPPPHRLDDPLALVVDQDDDGLGRLDVERRPQLGPQLRCKGFCEPLPYEAESDATAHAAELRGPPAALDGRHALSTGAAHQGRTVHPTNVCESVGSWSGYLCGYLTNAGRGCFDLASTLLETATTLDRA